MYKETVMAITGGCRRSYANGCTYTADYIIAMEKHRLMPDNDNSSPETIYSQVHHIRACRDKYIRCSILSPEHEQGFAVNILWFQIVIIDSKFANATSSETLGTSRALGYSTGIPAHYYNSHI